MVALRSALALFAAAAAFSVAAQPPQRHVIEGRLLHLRSGTVREWSEFPETTGAQRLELSFPAARNVHEATLRLRQQDVKQPWSVALNGKKVGDLIRDENDLILHLPLASGTLADGDNRLLIEPHPPRLPAESDDIRIGQIELHLRPRAQVLGETTVEVVVQDAATGDQVPCRITIVDENGALHTTSAISTTDMAVRPGVIYTATGRTRFGLPAGTYTIYAGRGFEWTVDQAQVALRPGDVCNRTLSILREVPTHGYVACDTHIHTLTHSGHGDATINERMITLAGEGIELPIATEHNLHIDYRANAERAGLSQHFTPVVGNEVTIAVGHFNVFPVEPNRPPVDHTGKSWPAAFAAINRVPDPKVVILNHARDLHSGTRPLGPEHFNSVAGEQLDGWPIGFNAMEVVNSGATQSEPLRLSYDWMALLNRGHLVTPVGSSDSHDVARYIVGQGRTCIRTDDHDPAHIDVEAAVSAFRQGRVLVSYGLLAELTVNRNHRPGDLCPVAGDQLEAEVCVLGPHWVRADRIRLYANGDLIRDEAIPQEAGAEQPTGIKRRARWDLPVPEHDVHLVAIATGPGIDKPYWPTAKPYQPTSSHWEPQTIGCSGAVWVDGDGDGKRTCARQYAEQGVAATGGDLPRLVERLARYDQATAAQAAYLLLASGDSLDAPRLEAAIKGAPPQVQAGFRSTVRAWQESQIALRGLPSREP